MAINRILPLFYLFTVSLPSAEGDELSAEFVFDALSRRIDFVIVELKRDVKRIENRIETIENNVCNKKTESKLSETTHTLIHQADCKNINEGTRPVFSEKLKRQTKAFYSMLKTEKAILREKVDHFQNLFHQLHTDITSRFALLNSSVGNSIENLEQIVNGHKAYTSVSLQDMSLDIQEKMNEYETNLAEMSLDIKRDTANKLYEVVESITTNAYSNISMMKCDFSSKLSSEISKVTSKIYEIHRKECFIHGSSEDYMGTQTTTQSGLECQRWDKQTPHKHRFRDDQFPDGSKRKAKNYCRDPGTDEGFPWCYTIDPNTRWKSCGIPRCNEPDINKNTHDCYIITDKNRESGSSDKEICKSQNKTRVHVCDANDDVEPGCENCNGCCQTKDCYSINHRYYNGTWHRGKSGRQCQRWDSQQPHQHSNRQSSKFPKDDSVFDAHNYCRDPDWSGFLWCYTKDPYVRWETCGIPDCYY